MAQQIADRIQIIDCDTHVSEPYDLWTSRVSQKWGDLVPYVVHSEESGRDVWALGGEYNPYGGVGGSAMAGWKEFPPNGPPTLAEADPACYDAGGRLQRMDDYGIHAAVVYPNVGGFGSGAFLRMKEPALMLECVRAYNDFLADWISPVPERFIPIPAMPFWDVGACVAEMHRVAKRGFKGIMWGSEPQVFDQPLLSDHHWEPIWATAQDLQLTVSFHTASGDLHEMREGSYEGNGRQANFARTSVLYFMGNARAVSELIVSGICHRYPALNFVSVESGVGWIPFLLEGPGLAVGRQWRPAGAPRVRPPAQRILPPPDLRLLLVRAGQRPLGPARPGAGQHPLRNGLPAPHQHVAGARLAGAEAARLRRGQPRGPARGGAAEGAARERRPHLPPRLTRRVHLERVTPDRAPPVLSKVEACPEHQGRAVHAR